MPLTPTQTRAERRIFRCPRSMVAVLAVAAVLAPIAVLTMIDAHQSGIGLLSGSADLHVYRDGAWRLRYGIPIYDGPTVYGHLYTYTPFSVIVFLALLAWPARIVDVGWMLCNLAILFGCVLQCWRMLGYRLNRDLVLVSVLVTSASGFLEPIRTTLFYGQINLVLLALLLWDFGRPDGSRLRGIGTGIAAGIKLTPLYFIAYSAALRQWRAVAVGLLTFVCTIVLAWAVIPVESRKFWTDRILRSDRVGSDWHPANQSLHGVYVHATGNPMPGWLWALLAGAVGVVNLWLAVRLFRLGERLLALITVGFGSSVVSPFSWSHHWVWFVPLFVYFLHRVLSDARWWLAVAGLFIVAGSWVYYYPENFRTVGLFMFPPWWIWPVRNIFLNVYVLAFVVVQVWVWRIGRGLRPVPADRSSARRRTARSRRHSSRPLHDSRLPARRSGRRW